MNKITVAVIYGGKSEEHALSIQSAENVMAGMDKEKYDIVKIFIERNGRWTKDGKDFSPLELPKICDFVLPIVHGPNCEDGTIQGVLELLNIPYGGPGVLGCAVTMDKITQKDICATYGVAQTPYVRLTYKDIEDKDRKAAKIKEITETLKLPYFVKPANMGSSVGITKVSDIKDLDAALTTAAKFDIRIIVEQGVDGREIEVAVMGNEDPVAYSCGEVKATAAFYSWDAKYNDPTSETVVPADISKEDEEKLHEIAIKAYKALGCSGFSRCDFLVDRKTGAMLLNEVNAIPGFTNISMFPKMCMAGGFTYAGIIDKIIELGYERYNAKNNR